MNFALVKLLHYMYRYIVYVTIVYYGYTIVYYTSGI